ncbi:hypothetical protein C8N24_0725 [Solirubrobacter pauli]|uniref:Uncharacterized protein n=1 Tax=Solirubrobacter pauli TaxID=166793 RepID=A0A660LAH3_9ACTN|nr:hypothetical protein C8N24_0725 [Solirubrobacter pauli]
MLVESGLMLLVAEHCVALAPRCDELPRMHVFV